MVYFLCFYEYIHRVCVYNWAYCWVKNKKTTYDVPTLFFSSLLRQHNNFLKSFGGGALLSNVGLYVRVSNTAL